MRNVILTVALALLCCTALTSCGGEEQLSPEDSTDANIEETVEIQPSIVYQNRRLVSYGTSTDPELLEIYKEYIQSGKYIYVGQVADSCSPSQKPTEHLTTNCGFVGDEVYRDADSDEAIVIFHKDGNCTEFGPPYDTYPDLHE